MGWFKQLVSKRGAPTRGSGDMASGEGVRFKEHLRLPGQIPGTQDDNYEVYDADTKETARAFLQTKTVTRPQYYVVVETPAGVFGKDRLGEYEPSRDWRGS